MSEQTQGQPPAAPAAPASAAGGPKKRHTFKFVLLGESAVGKSSIVTRFARNEFNQYNESTIGAAFVTKEVSLDEANVAVLRLWDTAGQERYKSLAPMYYRNAEGAVVVYDITQEDSFRKAQSWINELQRQNDFKTVIALVGNKLDLAQSKRTVSKEEGSRYAAEVNALFFETSAQTGEGVQELFVQLAKKTPRPIEVASASGQQGGPSSVNILSASSRGSSGAGTANDCAC
ncbi:GTP-binding protein of the rab/ypt [Coemansia spiralis]|uniref:GTP-binding protein of the rab/ypt n=1 Tax=Coemansia spiralis TaxID=417178 RepID=A0A9W8G6J6_9FUNG|nr:GTP-binding protein of the rab/ypt [Coemansia spiralis]